MANPNPVSIGRGSQAARQGLAGLSLFENAYVEDLGEQGKTSFTAQVINGCEEFASTNGEPVYKQLPLGSILLVVAGITLLTINQDGTTVTTVGGIPGDGPVTMAANRKTPDAQVAIVRSGMWHIYEGGTLTQGADPDLPPPIMVVEILGYFVFLIEDGRWFISENNGTTIDALDFAEAESSSDKNVAAAVRGRTLIIMGERTTEFWDVNGNAVFPFGFTAGISIGCYAAGSVCKSTVKQGNAFVDTIIWAATDDKGAYAGVVMLTGYSPVPISTAEVDRAIRDEPDKSSISAMAWTEDGHLFYSISGSSFTKVFDGKTGEWHGRKSRGEKHWYALSHAHFGDRVLFGHRDNGKIYESRADLKDEAGDEIVFRIQPPPIHMWPHRFQVAALYLDMIPGVGVTSTVETDSAPKLLLDYSKDGGRSWSAQRQYELGATGITSRRIIARQMGRFDPNGLTVRITCSARVVRALQQMAVEAIPLGA